MSAARCPICLNSYVTIGKHFTRKHSITNVKERKFLINWTRERVNINNRPCPVEGCNHLGTKLKRHILAHPELSKKEKKEILKAVKRTVAIGMLAELRASNPNPAMITTFDTDEELLAPESPPLMEEEAEECQNPACVRTRDGNRERDALLAQKNTQIESLKIQVQRLLKYQRAFSTKRPHAMSLPQQESETEAFDTAKPVQSPPPAEQLELEVEAQPGMSHQPQPAPTPEVRVGKPLPSTSGTQARKSTEFPTEESSLSKYCHMFLHCTFQSIYTDMIILN